MTRLLPMLSTSPQSWCQPIRLLSYRESLGFFFCPIRLPCCRIERVSKGDHWFSLIFDSFELNYNIASVFRIQTDCRMWVWRMCIAFCWSFLLKFTVGHRSSVHCMSEYMQTQWNYNWLCIWFVNTVTLMYWSEHSSKTNTANSPRNIPVLLYFWQSVQTLCDNCI